MDAHGLGPVPVISGGANALNRVSIEAPAAARIDMRARRGTTSGARLGPFPCGVAAKKAMRCVTKPCRGPTPAAFRALRMTFLTSNASPVNGGNRPRTFGSGRPHPPRGSPYTGAMIRWILVIFLALMLISWFTPLLQRMGFGKLPGDLRFKLFGREWFIPLTTTILLSMLAALVSKLL
jgi:hypothetical protein